MARLLLLAVLAALVGTGVVLHYGAGRAPALPEGIVSANGRVVVERIDIATKYAGRVAAIEVDEGDSVAAGAVVARLDAADVEAQLAEARAMQAQADQAIASARATLALRRAEADLAEIELRRAAELVVRDVSAQATLDQRRSQAAVAEAAVLGAEAAVGAALAARDAAAARVATVATMLDDMTLTSPVDGRVEYRLVQPGAVVAAGGRLASVLDLDDVHMVIYLPTAVAGALPMGAEARIRLDVNPDILIPARVSYVASTAQFTPKTVETEEERAKLMFRVKLATDPAVLARYRPWVRSGLTGLAYVKVSDAIDWPPDLAAAPLE